MKMAKEIFEEYGYVAGVNTEAKPPLTDYKWKMMKASYGNQRRN